MERTATFTITDIGGKYDIKCKAFNQYNRYSILKYNLFDTMSELADVFNNVLGIGICFVVE